MAAMRITHAEAPPRRRGRYSVRWQVMLLPQDFDRSSRCFRPHIQRHMPLMMALAAAGAGRLALPRCRQCQAPMPSCSPRAVITLIIPLRRRRRAALRADSLHAAEARRGRRRRRRARVATPPSQSATPPLPAERRDTFLERRYPSLGTSRRQRRSRARRRRQARPRHCREKRRPIPCAHAAASAPASAPEPWTMHRRSAEGRGGRGMPYRPPMIKTAAAVPGFSGAEARSARHAGLSRPLPAPTLNDAAGGGAGDAGQRQRAAGLLR